MGPTDKVNILLVDDQPGKLLSYEAILGPLGENLLTARSGREALQCLLRSEIAVILVDVCMPELDGFELAAMIREHPRYQKIAMIFISAIHLSDLDRLRGYEMGAVDYVPVPVVPEVLRAKVKIFAELYRKTRQLEHLNSELERRVQERTAELEASTAQLMESERRRSLALAAAQMGSWQWDSVSGAYHWDAGLCRIFGVDPETFTPTSANIRAMIVPDDWLKLDAIMSDLQNGGEAHHIEFRIRTATGATRWCIGSAAATRNAATGAVQISGVIIDISERKAAEERQELLAREVDHRAKNTLALVQALVRLTRATTMKEFVSAVEGRIQSLSRVHSILSQSRWEGASLSGLIHEELDPFTQGNPSRIGMDGPDIFLKAGTAQTLALVLHELATNTAKYGALSTPEGHVQLDWRIDDRVLRMEWRERGGPPVSEPKRRGFGSAAIVAGVKQQQGGNVVFDWQREGLRCSLEVPLQDAVAGRSVKSLGRKRDVPSGRAASSKPSIMIVEDEMLVALSLQESLTSLGYRTVGPYVRLGEALAAVDVQPVDFAVLDVNLAGELVYQLADVLKRKNIPFVFTTGYESIMIEPRFRGHPVLQKPVVKVVLENVLAEHFRRADAVSASVAN
ncbi:chemotaxis protein CheY [Afipia sp. P52-10]|uniref:HWE histidine kinase domain-containing protein n=1 Tax=Afipia sp. P52-10 TaxID=1429916 RepID=UPI0003DF439D|nr:HWE histidine kinase domain-containing protein [Afipia sp. P52-10]ETR76729.1 chemotaxis protein CheY [Afipia sp. P52-10]